jgi:hypothetical protein
VGAAAADKLLVLVADDPSEAPSSTSGRHRPHRPGSACGTVHTRQALAVLVLSQYVEVPLAMQLLGNSASGSNTC